MNLEKDQEVNIINEEGKVEQGFIVKDPKADRDGLITLKGTKPNEESIRVHPKRIISSEIKEVKPVEVQKTAIEIATPKINLDEYNQYGELWFRQVDFDSKTAVVSYNLIIPTQNRYVSFNTYNGTFGKKGKAPPVQAIFNGSNEGYVIKDSVEKMREGLIKKGYKRYGE